MNKVRTKTGIASRITRKSSGNPKQTQTEIPDRDLVRLAGASHAHDWLRDSDQDIYTLNDGKPASWPAIHTNGVA